MKRSLTIAIAAGIITLLGASSYQAVAYITQVQPATSVARKLPVQPFEVDPSWIKEGKPNFRATEFFKSHDGKTSSGIFECDGPSTFEWHYQLDEAIYVLDGGVDIEYQGQRFSLKPGETAFFRAGTTALWHVPKGIRKSWTLHDAGTPARGLARILN
ncbi:cupin domain-containing protein [Undibacterium sp. TS12]|uniref:cupin domain-containing protein n=1 Tax=Undibacterium sp. TS12 TaxID=2908202 RepID=UPI001F4C6796|nr:cupin domain-containing protein [Undibacterium sp. TS12]MCH8618378.1 cupin domain-containing protein [Undibacterium sp. TS12]